MPADVIKHIIATPVMKHPDPLTAFLVTSISGMDIATNAARAASRVGMPTRWFLKYGEITMKSMHAQMKHVKAAMVFLVVCALWSTAPFAGPIITAEVLSYTRNTTTITPPGGSTKSGGALFTLNLIAPAGTGIPGIDAQGKFLAMCLEPWQSVGTSTYQWNLADLEQAPTSGETHPMGISGADSILNALAYLQANSSVESLADLTQQERNALQGVLWLASNPSAAIGGLTVDENSLLTAMRGYSATAEQLAGFSVKALINLGTSGSGSGQDQFVFAYDPSQTVTNAPLPATVPLMLGGILCMFGVRRFRRT